MNTTRTALLGTLLLAPLASSGGPFPTVEPPAPVFTEPAATPDDWEFELGLYGFLAGIDGTVEAGNLSADIDFKFEDILENLDMTFMGSASARKGPFRIAGDVLYLGLSGDGDTRGIVFDNAKLELDTWIITVNGTYRVWDSPQGFLELGAGLRFFSTDVDVRVSDSAGRVPAQKTSDSSEVWDGLGVARFHYQFSPKFFFRCYGDVGAGDSDLTWQILAMLGYNISDSMAVFAGWRHLAYEFSSGDVDLDMSFSGPQIGAGFRF